jgi:hypothetical protein
MDISRMTYRELHKLAAKTTAPSHLEAIADALLGEHKTGRKLKSEYPVLTRNQFRERRKKEIPLGSRHVTRYPSQNGMHQVAM